MSKTTKVTAAPGRHPTDTHARLALATMALGLSIGIAPSTTEAAQSARANSGIERPSANFIKYDRPSVTQFKYLRPAPPAGLTRKKR